MQELNSSPIRLVGMVWYSLEDYAQIKATMADGNNLPPTYSQWRLSAEQGERQLRRQGHLVVRVPLDLDAFRDFCARRGHDLNSEGRREFAAFRAKEMHGTTH